ncbi:hypothetical protein GW17_00011580 [Ensete ventricosum]|nr:hypothetical protein GW17_00011580 [Ensete ventricosum]
MNRPGIAAASFDSCHHSSGLENEKLEDYFASLILYSLIPNLIEQGNSGVAKVTISGLSLEVDQKHWPKQKYRLLTVNSSGFVVSPSSSRAAISELVPGDSGGKTTFSELKARERTTRSGGESMVR